jgi:hypothetical protein
VQIDLESFDRLNADSSPCNRAAFIPFQESGPIPKAYINERAGADFVMAEESALLCLSTWRLLRELARFR